MGEGAYTQSQEPPRYTILHQVPDYKVFVAHNGRRMVVLKEQDSPRSAEISVLKQVDHPRITKLRDVIYRNVGDGLHHYAVLEYADGPSLRQLGRLPEDDALRIASQVCHAINYLHEQGLVYNDFKPENIHCTRRGAKVLDLEGCLPIDIEEPERLRGTPGYRCKDQVLGLNYPSNDVFGIGAVTYFMLSGQAPFPELGYSSTWNGLSQRQQDAHELKCLKRVPPALGLFNKYIESEVLRMLSADRTQRPSMQEVQQMLRHYAKPCTACRSCTISSGTRCKSAKRL